MAQKKDRPTSRRARWAWWIAGGVLVAVVLLPQLLLSFWGADLASRALTRELNKPVTIKSISGGWWDDLEVQELTIADAFEAKTDTLLEVSRIRFDSPLWMLLLPNAAIDVAIDDARLELRRLPNGVWNVTDLQPTRTTEPPENILLPVGALSLRITRGNVYFAPEDREYSLAAEAHSASLRDQPLEWHIELATRDGSSLSAKGSLANLATPRQITGTTSFQLTRFDLAMIPPLVPALPVMYPHGIIQEGNVKLDLSSLTQFRVRAFFDLRNMSLPDIGHESEASLSRGSVSLALGRNDEKWTFDTLSLEGPDGTLALEPGDWFELGAETWRGNLNFRADLKDTEPASRALAMLLPDALILAGALHLEAELDGAVSLDTQKTWTERFADLKANLALSLARAQWENEQIEDLVATVSLDSGRVAVPKISASIGKGHANIQGELTAGKDPGGNLTWRVRDVSLGNLLGAEEVRVFDITGGSGQVTFDGSVYGVESQTTVRELSFDREALGDRELRITDARLDCMGTLPPDLARFDVSRCRVKAEQGELTSTKGQIDFGTEPTLELDVKGWLGGLFLSALVPEFAPQWPARVNIKGPLTVPLSGQIWPNMKWRFDAGGKRFVYAEMEFTDLEARLTKSVGRLDFRISGRRSQGSLVATGSLELESKNIASIELKADRIPVRSEIGGYRIAGTVFGSARVTIDAQGERVSFQNRLEDAELSHGQSVLSRLSSGKLEGELERTGRGRLWAKRLSLVGDGLNARIHDSHLPLTAGDEPLELNLEFTGDGSWLNVVAALAGPNPVLAAGQSQLTLKLRSEPGQVLGSMKGEGELKLAQLSVWGNPLSNVHLAFDLEPNAIHVSRGEARHDGGKLTVDGNVVLPLFEARRDQRLVVAFEQMPVRHDEPLSSYENGGPANLITETRLSGRILWEAPSGGRLAVNAELQSEPITRRIVQRNEKAAEMQLPPLRMTSTLVPQNSLENWRVETFTVSGQGALIELTNGELTRRNPAYELAGILTVELAPAFLRGATMGRLPARIDLNGDMKASGQTKFRIPLTRPFAAADVEFSGTMNMQELRVEADTLSDLRFTLRLAGGRLDVRDGEASLLGGRMWLPSPSNVNLEGPGHDFNIYIAGKDLHLQTHAGRKVSLGTFLALLLPVFIFTPDSDEKANVTGVLQFDLELEGTYRQTAAWTESVNGNGSFRIDGGTIQGSTLFTSIFARSLLMPTNVVNNTVAALFSRNGQVGRELADLADDAFRFETIQSPITIRGGEIFLEKNLQLSAPELTLTINGHSHLNGELDYRVDTDLIKRVRLGEITDLPNKIPVIGKVLSFLNPFTYLDGIELQARVTGNVLKQGPDGRPDVRVNTSVVDTKAG